MLELKNIKYEKKEVKIFIALVVLFFIFSAVCWIFSKPGKRYTFYFESADTKKLAVEYSYLPFKSYPENVLQYVDEIILGPKTERYKSLFSFGTTVVSSFVRDNVLYINLSEDVLDRAGSCSEIKVGVELFKKNVLKTFPKLDSIKMFIGNKSIYTQDLVDEDFKK